MIERLAYPDLNPALRSELVVAVQAEFGHIAVVQAIDWATPDWVFIWREGEQLTSFYHLVERTVLLDGRPCRTGGLHNVITPSAYRGRGFSSRLIRETESFWWQERQLELGLLLCADALLPFYERLGWQRTDAATYFEQPTGRQRWSVNTMLRFAPGVSPVLPQEISLEGRPW